ncbi:MAG TPA: phytanoyl-CoA dioxygenase family protein [Bacillota bacterium]|nr:phytanoyl-CoA dioxygenase family protein [Bacillota bacterium]
MDEQRRRSARWREDYLRDGFLVVEGVLDAAELATLGAALERIEQRVAEESLPPRLRQYVTLERDQDHAGSADTDKISNIMELPLFDPVFRDLIINASVLDILEALFGSSEFSFHNYKAICKMPGGAASFRWHRDLPYLPHTSSNLITCMLCIDPMTTDNGATVVCPGSHRIADDRIDAGDKDIAEAEVPAERLTIECPAGSAVLFDTNIVHGGGPNRSDRPRRNAIGIWAGPDVHPTTASRYAYEFVMPRSTDPQRQLQVQQTFGTA